MKPSINIEELKKKFQQRATQITNQTSNFLSKEERAKLRFIPSHDEQRIRLLPFEDGLYFKQYYFHYNVMGQSIYCPQNDNEPCPLCELAKDIRTSQGADATLKDLAGTVEAKLRTYSPVSLKKQENGKWLNEGHVRYWDYSVTVEKLILNELLDQEVQEEINGSLVYDPEFGIDFRVWTTPKKGKGFGEDYTVKSARKGSPLSESEEERKTIIDSIKDPMEVFKVRTDRSYQQLKDLLEEWKNSGFTKEYVKKTNDSQSESQPLEESDSNTSLNVQKPVNTATSEQPVTPVTKQEEVAPTPVKTEEPTHQAPVATNTNDVKAKLDEIKRRMAGNK